MKKNNKINNLAKKDQELITLLQELIRIPSWVPEDPKLKKVYNENKVVDYLESWLKTNTNMEVIRQPLKGGRFNLIAKRGKPDLVFLAHTDTVKPSEDAPFDQLSAIINNEEIWGRGASDMKSGIATMIQALSLSPDTNNIWLFLYADEEYDFLGMKALVKKFGDIKPKLIVSSDGSDLQLGYGCRGLIEIKARVIGETGHPAKEGGKNAIWEGFETLYKLKTSLQKTKHKVMGPNSFNVAYTLGGAKEPTSIDSDNSLVSVGQAGNVVPDIMEFVLDIRPSSQDINLESIIKFIEKDLKKKGLGFEVINKKHDLGAWFTPASKIKKYEALASKYSNKSKPLYSNPKDSGYLDLQMFWEAVGRPTAFMYGGGIGETNHSPQERISIIDLIRERNFFIDLLESRLE
ncbi:MAG: M20/M25/M40 family metallo-hydrolase [Candidatus Pacebacteria bacterium]|nr:M20/M25/M40 family metallo-hydrolase [Candidatus Paceibacterota bacterium]